MISYSQRRAWSDQFIPAIKRAVGPFLLEVSSYEVDTREAADLTVFSVDGNLRIAARVRTPGYFDRYWHQFTIRSRLDSGTKTELAKFREGYCDWMFYGHADIAPGRLKAWVLLDLGVWRLVCKSNPALGEDIPNGDGTYFMAFDLLDFYDAIIAADGIPLNGCQPAAGMAASGGLR